jgi:hypothetical protein
MQLKRHHQQLFSQKEIRKAAANSGFAQRGDLCFKKSSSCFEVHVTFDTLEL